MMQVTGRQALERYWQARLSSGDSALLTIELVKSKQCELTSGLIQCLCRSNGQVPGSWRLSLAHTRGNGIDQSELPPTYTAQLLMEVAIAAATCIAAVPANEPTTRLGAHDGLHLRRVILLHPPRIKFLARIHRPHHTHAEIHPQVTNRLSIAERLSLILLANFSLDVIGNLVPIRTAFVPFVVGLLVDVHSGLDLPWGYDKILPFGMGGRESRPRNPSPHG